jgi:hypothetical protein
MAEINLKYKVNQWATRMEQKGRQSIRDYWNSLKEGLGIVLRPKHLKELIIFATLTGHVGVGCQR